MLHRIHTHGRQFFTLLQRAQLDKSFQLVYDIFIDVRFSKAHLYPPCFLYFFTFHSSALYYLYYLYAV